MSMHRLVGTWVLHSFEIRFSDNRPPLLPFGDRPSGLLIYTADGYMSATLAKRERNPLSVDQLELADRGRDVDKVAAFDSYLSYGGTYAVDGKLVTHHLTTSLVPDLVGTDNVRHYRFVGDALELSYKKTAKSGIRRDYLLTWERPN